MSKITGTIYNKSKNYEKGKQYIHKIKPKRANLTSTYLNSCIMWQNGFKCMNYSSNVGPMN